MDNTTVVSIEFFMTAEISKGLLVRALSCQRQVLCKSFKGYCVNVTTDGRPDNRAERACVSLPCCTGTRHDDSTAHGGVNSASRHAFFSRSPCCRRRRAERMPDCDIDSNAAIYIALVQFPIVAGARRIVTMRIKYAL
jgi:hypothetical protein